jgi:carbon-monoxide dehydrogenase medium subunit/xanthine dehydrogenase FAD-binding subunit
MTITVFHKPDTLQACLQQKAESGDRAILLAGGTDVLVHLHEGKLKGSEIIDLTGLDELKGIEIRDGSVRIGAAATFTEVGKSPLLARCSGLQEACLSVGSPQIRNAGTLGGNIANGSPAADSAPPLLALGSTVILQKASGIRRIPLCEFYVGKGQTVLETDEVLTALEFPVLPENSVLVFEKLGLRNALAISRISLSLYLKAQNGMITEVRAASGSIGLNPMREPALEAFLTGKPLSEEWIPEGMTLFSKEVAARLAGRGTMPYKRIAVMGVFENAARKAIRQLSAEQ